MSFLVKLAKIISFWATCGLLLNGLGQIDLASWGVNNEWREKIEMVLQAKEFLREAVEIIPWGKTVSERSTEIQLVAAAPGIVLVLIEGILSLLRFLIGVGVLAALVGMAFVYAPTLFAGRVQSPPVVQYQPTPIPFGVPSPGSHGFPHRR
jgi:hypothetical protein